MAEVNESLTSGTFGFRDENECSSVITESTMIRSTKLMSKMVKFIGKQKLSENPDDEVSVEF